MDFDHLPVVSGIPGQVQGWREQPQRSRGDMALCREDTVWSCHLSLAEAQNGMENRETQNGSQDQRKTGALRV